MKTAVLIQHRDRTPFRTVIMGGLESHMCYHAQLPRPPHQPGARRGMWQQGARHAAGAIREERAAGVLGERGCLRLSDLSCLPKRSKRRRSSSQLLRLEEVWHR